MIQAVIFDFDGLMVDTETPAYHAFRKIYEEYGTQLPLEIYAQCVGTSFEVFNPYTYLSECLSEPVDPNIVKVKVDVYYKQLLQGVAMRTGVEDYLIAAKRLGLKVGLASSSYYNWIEPYFTKFNLEHYFDAICTADVVKNVKPDSELYLLALEKLEVSADQAISFEDSLNGFIAAKGAGLHTVIVPNEMTRTFPFKDYDLMISSMTDIKLEDLVDQLELKAG